jgi:hypothetical protein
MTAWALGSLIVLAVLSYFFYRTLPAFLRFRGARVVACPETGQPAGVEVDASRAAVTALGGKPELRLTECSRWPERAGCGQDCLRQIESSPEGCLVRTLVTSWYSGKTCVYCGKPFGEIHWHDHKPALQGESGTLQAWAEVPTEKVPDALAWGRPVCWSCFVAESFRREHPDLVVDRPWRNEPPHPRPE